MSKRRTRMLRAECVECGRVVAALVPGPSAGDSGGAYVYRRHTRSRLDYRQCPGGRQIVPPSRLPTRAVRWTDTLTPEDHA